jgi:hypothetical protein
MSRATWKLINIGIAAVAAMGGLAVDEEVFILKSLNPVSHAEARVGRPLTPLSYAGVARRTTRRAVAVGAATSGCVQVVDAYGRIVTRCY